MIIETDITDSTYNILYAVSPISPITLGLYYDVSVNGCARRCPCRLWTNCGYYNTGKWKESRGNEELIWNEVHDYYENYFKFRPEMPESNMNA